MGDATFNLVERAKRMPLLTKDEEIIHAKSVQAMMRLLEENPNGPYTTKEQRILRVGKKAKDRMITANIRLIGTVANQIIKGMPQGSSMTWDDCIQEGTLGLVRGVERFDPTRGYKLSTYAFWWIRQSIMRAITNQARAIRLPLHVCELVSKICKTRVQMAHELGRDPNPDELAERLGVPEEKLRYTLQVMAEVARPTSLDAPILGRRDDDGFLVDLIQYDHPDEHDDLVAAGNKALLAEALTLLDDRERFIVTRHFGLDGEPPLTLQKIGDSMKLTRERVRQIEDRAKRRIRLMMASSAA